VEAQSPQMTKGTTESKDDVKQLYAQLEKDSKGFWQRK